MRSLAQFIAFQVFWCVAVLGAGAGHVWLGALALVPYLVWMLARGEARARLATHWIAAGLLGSLVDCGLRALGLLVYPTAGPGWPSWLVPPFIVSLWIAFATLPHVSLAWLAERPLLAMLLGAVGGPLSFAAGERAGAVAHGASVVGTNIALALEYALVTPLFARWLGPPGAPRLAGAIGESDVRRA